MPLSKSGKRNVRKKFSEYLRGNKSPLGMNRAQLNTTIDNSVTWVEDNKVSFSGSLPPKGKTTLNVTEKTKLHSLVIDEMTSEGL